MQNSKYGDSCPRRWPKNKFSSNRSSVINPSVNIHVKKRKNKEKEI